jgi:hypothetical protein
VTLLNLGGHGGFVSSFVLGGPSPALPRHQMGTTLLRGQHLAH